MTKASILKALENFAPEDHVMIEDMPISYSPRFQRICGKSVWGLPYYCALPPGHEGNCYCRCKNVEFNPADYEDEEDS